MTKRIFRSILLVALAVLLSCFALFLGVLYEYFGSVQTKQLKTQLAFADQGVEDQGLSYLQALEPDGCRLTWVNGDGHVLFDSFTDPAGMENHAQRAEILEALSSGSGESARYSSTLTEQTLYFAKRLSDGTVLRISVSRMTTLSLVMSMLQPLFVVLAIALILSGVLAARLSKKIVRPLEAINFDRPLENDTYEELSPILHRMEQQHDLIKAQKAQLQERRQEFYAVISKMNEALVLLNPRGEVLSINPAAERFFSADGDCTGRDFITVERAPEVTAAIDDAREKGYAEVQISRLGREYLLRASRVEESGGGVVLLVFDITERFFAERNRREFTANVSHELKTPLQSIMGSAELLENGLVKPEDTGRFLGNIRREASRLVLLIEDVLRLSRLDEGAPMPREDVDMLDIAEEIADSLKLQAQEKQVTVQVSGEHCTFPGVRGLVFEIVQNLCSNAVKYN
ncbi:MAG: histidine kinase dimerization/phospho-acceptor domain-containing protein, partial [Oscillospiraceae bacterium]|nr:histidine kinase dimerization/phospho-acceptor domain-containing protein [Oscillospiraceae bacterium]